MSRIAGGNVASGTTWLLPVWYDNDIPVENVGIFDWLHFFGSFLPSFRADDRSIQDVPNSARLVLRACNRAGREPDVAKMFAHADIDILIGEVEDKRFGRLFGAA